MISTEEDDTDEDYNEGKYVKRPDAPHLQEQKHCLTPLDHESHTPLPPSQFAIAHAALTSSFPIADESPPPLPSPGHDATHPAVVRHTATPHRAHNTVWRGRSYGSVAETSSACSGKKHSARSAGCDPARCDQTSLHPGAKSLITYSVHGSGRKLDLSTSACLNSNHVLTGLNCPFNFDLTSGRACRLSSADNPISSTQDAQSSSPPPPSPDHFECSPSFSYFAADASLYHSEPLLSGCTTTTTTPLITLHHHHRCPSQYPSKTPRSVSPAVARKPPQRQDHATGTSVLDSTSRHTGVESSVGGTVSNTSGDGREISINHNIDNISQLSSFTSPRNVAAIPPLEQPLPPPSPPPPPDDTVSLLSPELTASWSRSPQHTLYASSQLFRKVILSDGVFTNNAEECDVANRCLNVQQSERRSDNLGPVFNLMSSASDDPLSRTIHRSVIEGSKINEMHHNGVLCFNGQERTSGLDLVCNLETVFNESLSYVSNGRSHLPQCVSLPATAVSCNQDTEDEPSKQSYKVCNCGNETEPSFKSYASSDVSRRGCGAATISGCKHGQTSSDLLYEFGSRNTGGTDDSSFVEDFRNVSVSELLSSNASRQTPASEPWSSLVEDFGDPILFRQNCRGPATTLPTKSLHSDSCCINSSPRELICQRNSLINSTGNLVDTLSESLEPTILQNHCLNSEPTVAPAVSSFSSCIPYQHTSPSPAPPVVDSSSSLPDAESPVNSVQTVPNLLHRQARITNMETTQKSTTTLDVNCTCSSNYCKANEVDEPVSPCFDFDHDILQRVVIASNISHSGSTVLSSPKQNLDNTPIFEGEVSTASGLPPHPQESVRTTEGPPASTTVGEDDQVILPSMAGADRESCEDKMDSDSLLATTGLVLMHSQSSQDSGIASVPLEECYLPPLSAVLPCKILTSIALNSCCKDFIGSLECDVVPGNAVTPSHCANTLVNTISPSDDGTFVYEPPNSIIQDGMLPHRDVCLTKPAIEQPSASSSCTLLCPAEDAQCRLGGRASSVSFSQSCSVSRPYVDTADDSISQLDNARQPTSISSSLCPNNIWNKERLPHTEGPDQVFTVPTTTHHHSIRSNEVALDKTCEAFESVITAHRSALQVLVPERIPSVGDASCLSDTSQILFEQGQSKDNTSIFSEDGAFYPSDDTAFSTGIQTEASEQTNISLHCTATPCAGDVLVSDDASDGVTSNGDAGFSKIRQDNNGESCRTKIGVATSDGRNQAPSLSLSPKVVSETAADLKSNEPSITGTSCVEYNASSGNEDTIFLSKLDQFASHLAKELVQESVLLSSTHAWNIRCSGQCRREQCRQDYYQSLLLLNASLCNDPVAAAHDYINSSQAEVKKGTYGSTSAKPASIYSSSSSSSYGRNSSSSVWSGGWLNSLTHRGGGDRRDSVNGGSGAGDSSGRTSAMVLALSSGGSPGLCWTPELPDASESGGKTVDEEEYLSPRDSDNSSGCANSGCKKLFGGGEGSVVIKSVLGKRSPYQFQKTISTNTTSTNLNVPFGRVEEISTEPERINESRGLAESISKEFNHVTNPRSRSDVVVNLTLGCPSPSLPTSSPPSLPASLPPSRSSLSPPPSLSSNRPTGYHSWSSLSVSHDSLVCRTSTAHEASVDDSHLITAAYSHDALHYGGHEDVVATASMLSRDETHKTKQARDTNNSDSQHLPAEAEDHPSSLLLSNERVEKRERVPLVQDCDSNSDMFCPRTDPTSCPVGKESSGGGHKKKRRTKSRKRSPSNKQQQRSSKSSSHASNQFTTTTTSNEEKFYRKSRKHKILDPSEVYSVPIDSIEDPGIVHPKAVIATQPRRHSHRKHRVTSSTITAGLPLLNSSNIITNSNADVVSNSFGEGTNGVNDACRSNVSDLRVVIGGKVPSKDSKKKRFSSNKQSRAAVASSVELSSPSPRQSIVSNFGCGNNNNKSSVLSSPKHKTKHPDGKQSVASDPIHMATDDIQKAGHGSSDHEVHSDTVHQTYSNPSRVSRKERHEHHSRICRILPFTALKSCKRKDHSSESRDDVYVAAAAQSRATGKNSTGDQRKRGHSLFSNIRNSLLSLFSFGGSGGSDRSLSKEHKLRLKSSIDRVEGLRSSTSLDSDSQAVISTSGSEVSTGGCEGAAPAGPYAATKMNDVTAVDLLNHSNYSAFTSAVNVASPRSVIGAAGADVSEGGRDRGYNGGGIDGLVLSPEEQNCHGDDTLNKETLQRSNNADAVRAALLVPPPLPPANNPTTNSNNNPLHTVPSVSTSSALTTSSAPLIASSAVGCRSPVPVISNRALPPLPSAQTVSSISNKATNNSIIPSAGNATTICADSPTPPPIPPPLPQSLLSAVGPPLPPPLPATLRHSVAASIAAKASATGAGESRETMDRGGGAANSDAPLLQAEKAGVFLVHGNAASIQESMAACKRKEEEGCHFATMIEKVKDYGWYWGPISGKAAEKIISNEPDGSFIVRDSSDDHYIFSLTFKLNDFTRHVRIEHAQGNFSFGGYTKFKSQTIVEFIESAVEHSRSGRYLFFLHRRPVPGPLRVQLLHPVSRHRHIQSLQHLCRFVIVKNVRRDLLQQLPLPVRLRDYLTSPHYYSEQVDQCMAEEEEEEERALQEAALVTGGVGHEDSSQGHEEHRRTLEEAALDANSIREQHNNVPPIENPQEIEPNRVSDEQVGSNLEGQHSVSPTNPVQTSHQPSNPTSGGTRRKGLFSDEEPDCVFEASSNSKDDSVVLGASSINNDLNFRHVIHQKSREGIDFKSMKGEAGDGCEAAAADNSMSSCSNCAKSGRSADVESPTLECHAVLEALNCLDESITQAEASILAQAKCPSDEHACVQSVTHPSYSCILSDKCISAVSNPAYNFENSRVDTASCSNPPTAVLSNKSSCDSGATTPSLCSKSTKFSSSSVVSAADVSSKPPLSLSSYLHATPRKKIHKYKPGKIVSYQVDLASDSPTIIKLTKLVDQRISDEFRKMNGSIAEDNSTSANKGKIDEEGNTVSTTNCKSNLTDTHADVQSKKEDFHKTLQAKSGAELMDDRSEHSFDHLLDCCSVDSAVIGLVDLETPFWNNEVDEITFDSSSENNQSSISKSRNGHLTVLEDSRVHRQGSGVEEDELSMSSKVVVTSSRKLVHYPLPEEDEKTYHADCNKNSVVGGQDGCCSSSSSGVVVSSPHARHPTLQQSFVNSTSSLPSVILNASLEELGSF